MTRCTRASGAGEGKPFEPTHTTSVDDFKADFDAHMNGNVQSFICPVKAVLEKAMVKAQDGQIITPDVSAGMLHGITRRFVLEEVAPETPDALEIPTPTFVAAGPEAAGGSVPNVPGWRCEVTRRHRRGPKRERPRAAGPDVNTATQAS